MSRRSGFTLTELMISILVLLIIVPILGMIISNYFNLYQEYFARINLNTRLPEVQRTMFIDLSNASRFVVTDLDAIAFRVPSVDEGGDPEMPFDRDGILLAYYLSDDSGNPDVDGNVLWLAKAEEGSWDLQPLRAVASSVTDFQIQYLDMDGNAFSMEELQGVGFSDETIAWVNVYIEVLHPGENGLSGDVPAEDFLEFNVASRNNHR